LAETSCIFAPVNFLYKNENQLKPCFPQWEGIEPTGRKYPSSSTAKSASIISMLVGIVLAKP